MGGNDFGPLGMQMLKGGLGALRKNLTVHLDDTDSGSGPSGSVPIPSAPSVERPNEPTPSSSSTLANGHVELARRADGQRSCKRSFLSETVEPDAHRSIREASTGATGVRVTSNAVTIEIIEVEACDHVRVVVPLPEGVSSAADLDLDVSVKRLMVRHGEVILADEELPREVDTESAQAAFSRKKGRITITLRAVR